MMIENLLITPSGNSRGKWLDAFPEGLVVADKDTKVIQDAQLIWLDYDRLTGAQKLNWLRKHIDRAKKIVVMSSDPSEEEAFQVIKEGAYGYCHAFAVPNQFTEVATVITHGGIWVGPQVLQRILKTGIDQANPEQIPPAVELMSLLSKREKMVATHVSRGASNKNIANALGITERTVKAHISAMFEKLMVRDRVQLALKLNNVEI